MEMLASLPPDALALEALHPSVRGLAGFISGAPLPSAPPGTPLAKMAVYQLQSTGC
jgi:hypothetical protein